MSLQSKVKNRLWVLNECVERVPEDYEAAKQLLRYGLLGTDAKVVDAVGHEKRPLPFIIKAKEDELEDDDERKKKHKELEESLKFVRYCSNMKISTSKKTSDISSPSHCSVLLRDKQSS